MGRTNEVAHATTKSKTARISQAKSLFRDRSMHRPATPSRSAIRVYLVRKSDGQTAEARGVNHIRTPPTIEGVTWLLDGARLWVETGDRRRHHGRRVLAARARMQSVGSEG
jgi:hypothetical protein